MKKHFRSLIAAALLSVTFLSVQAQPAAKEIKPYKITGSGRQLFIKSNKTIQHIMVWTTDGNRVVEQKNINHNNITIDIPISRRTFFLMIGLADGKIYTEKRMMQ
jgi:hypothetical protein